MREPDHCGMSDVAKKKKKVWNLSMSKKQDVPINGFKSNTSTLTFGVPQGSVLEHLLFLIYVNNLYNSVKFCQWHHYANYTKLLHINASPKILN